MYLYIRARVLYLAIHFILIFYVTDKERVCCCFRLKSKLHLIRAIKSRNSSVTMLIIGPGKYSGLEFTYELSTQHNALVGSG